MACDPSNPNYTYYSTNYGLTITATYFTTNYSPGDTATISGTVTLKAQDVYYSADCNEFSTGNIYAVNPTGVNVSLSSGMTTTVGSDGAFSFNVLIPADAPSGSREYTITATHSSGASASAPVTINVQAYSPKISVTGSGTYYPGDTIVFAGAGWAPGKPVTVKFLGLQQDVDGPAFSGEFKVPDNAAENTYNILATQEPNLQATTTVTVQWRPLTLSLTSQPSFHEGDNIIVTGTLASNNGPVEGAVVTVTYFEKEGGSVKATGTGNTAADGTFSIQLTIPTSGSWATYVSLSNRGQCPAFQPQGTISATATKAQGYKSPSNAASYTARLLGPSDSLMGMIADVAKLPLAFYTTLEFQAAAAAIQGNAIAASFGFGASACAPVAAPLAFGAVSGAALLGLLYYRFRNPAPPEHPFPAPGAPHG